MTSPLKATIYRPAGRLGLYVRAFQVFSTADPPAGVSVLDFGGGDVSVPVCFGDPVRVEDWGVRRCRPRPCRAAPARHVAAVPGQRRPGECLVFPRSGGSVHRLAAAGAGALAAEATTPANPGRALLAAKYGYADQAHLAREFRELTGFTPSGLARVGSDADFLQDALACHRGVFKPAIA